VEAKSSLVCLFVSLWYQCLFIDHRQFFLFFFSILMATPTAFTMAVVSLQHSIQTKHTQTNYLV